MKHLKWRRLYAVARYTSWAALGAVTLIGAVLEVDTTKTDLGFIAPAIIWIQPRAGLLVLGLSILGGGLRAGMKFTGPPWVWEAVHDVLDDLRKRVFDGRTGEVHHHRATLFKHQQWSRENWRHPFRRGWLVPVERSGHTTQKCSVRFRAPDDADQAEGVAGLAWATAGTVEVSALPDLGANPSPTDFREYADKTRVTVDWLEPRNNLARSLSGFPILTTKGKQWGVIVLDSRSPDPIQDRNESYKVIGRFLSKLLERT